MERGVSPSRVLLCTLHTGHMIRGLRYIGGPGIAYKLSVINHTRLAISPYWGDRAVWEEEGEIKA